MIKGKTFSEQFKESRNATGLSVAKLAELMLIPKRSLEKWESGERVPPPYVQRFVLNELEELKRNVPIIDAETWKTVQYKRRHQTETDTPKWKLPLGYKYEDGTVVIQEGGKVVVDEEEAEIVKRAAEEMERDGRVSPETEKELRRAWKEHYKN